MFSRTRYLSNPFAIDHMVISLFDVESQIFVTMATRASLWQISVTPLNCPRLNTQCLVQNSPLYIMSFISRVIANFLLIFLNVCYHGNKGRSGVNFNDTVRPKLHDLKNSMPDARFLTVSHISRVVVNFVLKYLLLVTMATRVDLG